MKKLFPVIISLLLTSMVLVGCGAGEQSTPTSLPLLSPTAAPPSTPTSAPAPAATTASQPTATKGAAALEKVTFSLDWTPNTNHTGIYVAQAKGWYKVAGLDVQILPYSDANTPDTLVANGQADFGVSFAESVVLDRVGKLPVKSVAAILQTNTSALATLKTSGLDKLSKLEGKKYSGFGSPFEQPVISTMLKQDGAPTGNFENITTNLSGLDAVVAKQADFVWIYMGWEGIQAKLDGVELNTFMVKDHGVPDYYTPVIIANETFLQKRGDIGRRFLDATARGYEYGVSNPKDAADILISASPAATFASSELPRQSQAYLAPYYKGDQPRWGIQTLQKWTDFPRFLANTGLLKTPDGTVVNPGDIDYAALFTNDYLPKP